MRFTTRSSFVCPGLGDETIANKCETTQPEDKVIKRSPKVICESMVARRGLNERQEKNSPADFVNTTRKSNNNQEEDLRMGLFSASRAQDDMSIHSSLGLFKGNGVCKTWEKVENPGDSSTSSTATDESTPASTPRSFTKPLEETGNILPKSDKSRGHGFHIDGLEDMQEQFRMQLVDVRAKFEGDMRRYRELNGGALTACATNSTVEKAWVV